MSQNQDKVKTIYDLEFHGIINIGNYTEVMRVPGGWLYKMYDSQTGFDAIITFVPYNEEFKRDKI